MIGLTSPTHLALLLLIALLLFGAKRVPEIGRSLGSGMREFKDSISHETALPETAEQRDDRLMRPRRLPREEEATLVEHLEELRGRIMVGLAAVAVATAVAFVFHNHILEWLARPLPPEHRHLAAFGVAEPFSVSIAVSLYAGILFALPVILWQLWSFLVPALDPAAERRILGFALFGLVLGATGLAFGYGVLLPRAVHFLTGYDTTHSSSCCGRAATTRSWSRCCSASSASSRRRWSCSRSSTSACSRRPGCAGTGARATSSSRPWRWRCRAPIP